MLTACTTKHHTSSRSPRSQTARRYVQEWSVEKPADLFHHQQRCRHVRERPTNQARRHPTERPLHALTARIVSSLFCLPHPHHCLRSNLPLTLHYRESTSPSSRGPKHVYATWDVRCEGWWIQKRPGAHRWATKSEMAREATRMAMQMTTTTSCPSHVATTSVAQSRCVPNLNTSITLQCNLLAPSNDSPSASKYLANTRATSIDVDTMLAR